jgi:hypothetical protein
MHPIFTASSSKEKVLSYWFAVSYLNSFPVSESLILCLTMFGNLYFTCLFGHCVGHDWLRLLLHRAFDNIASVSAGMNYWCRLANTVNIKSWMDRENLAYLDLCLRERFRRLKTTVFNMNMPNCGMQAFFIPPSCVWNRGDFMWCSKNERFDLYMSSI